MAHWHTLPKYMCILNIKKLTLFKTDVIYKVCKDSKIHKVNWRDLKEMIFDFWSGETLLDYYKKIAICHIKHFKLQQ